MLLSTADQMNWIYELYLLGQADTGQDTPELVYENILRHVMDGFGAGTGSLVLYKTDEDSPLNLVAGIGLPPACIGEIIPKGNGIIGWVLTHKQPLLLKGNLNNDSRFHDHIPKPDAKIPPTALCWPLLRARQQAIGALCINNYDREHGFTEADIDRGRNLINLITLVIDNLRLHNEQHKRIKELAASNQRYIEANQQFQLTHRQLQQSEKRLNAILDSLDSVVWSMEPDSLKILYLNKAAHQVSGRPVEDFFNDPALWLKIIDPNDIERINASLTNLASEGTQKVTYRIQRPDGEIRWLFHHMRMVLDDTDRPLRIDGITVDVTEHKKAEDLLKLRNKELQSTLGMVQEMQAQLVQSEKLSSIGQLAAGVAHEINNPIGYINSNLSSLNQYVQDVLKLIDLYEDAELSCSDTQKLNQIDAHKTRIDLDFIKSDVIELLHESQEGASRVKKIVQDLKDFSHAGGADEWEWADLHACLESTLNIVNNEIKYRAGVVKKYGDIPQVWCLPHQLNQIFMNLLVNAAHAIENEGTITIRTGAENNTVWVDVSDTGKGIAPEHINKIFDPFFTTKPVGKGTGLGLSVSYNIVKKHHGEIQVNSRIGEGTTFRVVLPKKEQPVDV